MREYLEKQIQCPKQAIRDPKNDRSSFTIPGFHNYNRMTTCLQVRFSVQQRKKAIIAAYQICWISGNRDQIGMSEHHQPDRDQHLKFPMKVQISRPSYAKLLFQWILHIKWISKLVHHTGIVQRKKERERLHGAVHLKDVLLQIRT